MIEPAIIYNMTNSLLLCDTIEKVKSQYKNYKDIYSFHKFFDQSNISFISLIEYTIPHLVNNKILEIKKFNKIEWLPNTPCLKVGMLVNTNDEFWYVEYSYHEGFNMYYYSCVYDFLINFINTNQISYNKMGLRSELYKILHYFQYLKTTNYDYILIEKINTVNGNYYKYLCKYNDQIYYILYDIKHSNKILFIL